MMRTVLASLLALGVSGVSGVSTTVALAEPTTATKPTAAPSPAPAPATCKRLVVGHGLDRHVVCQFEAPVIVKVDAPRPAVLIVSHDGKAVVGRPTTGDRFAGLSHRLN